jgi:glycosyltransferase involved in cell wall biosynthesis
MTDISICIPVYNFLIEPLVIKLLKEIKTSSISAEIIIIDDSSGIDIQKPNHQAAEKYSFRYIRLEKNIGRSAIRNLFVNYTNADTLLFLDCDVMPVSESFIHDYLTADPGKKIVVCGGISYANHFEKNKKLHWKYGRRREAIPADKRNEKSYCYFLTGNFLIPKKVLQQIHFNEELKGYGYEDTLYAIELERSNIEIKHINLPADHLRLDGANAFIAKTENALQNLFFLYQLDEYKVQLALYIKLVRAYLFLNKYKLTGIAYFTYKIAGKKIKMKLMKGSTNLRLLDLYKLLFFIALVKQGVKPY